MDHDNDYDVADNPVYADVDSMSDHLRNTKPVPCVNQYKNTSPATSDNHYSTPKPALLGNYPCKTKSVAPAIHEQPTKPLPATNNSNKSGIVVLVIFVTSFNFLLALCGVVIGTFAFLQSAGPSMEQASASSLSSSAELSSTEALRLQVSIAALREMVEDVNRTMKLQLHLTEDDISTALSTFNEKILEINMTAKNISLTPGTYVIGFEKRDRMTHFILFLDFI